MLVKMVKQGLLMALVLAALAYGYQAYRADRIDTAFNADLDGGE